MEKAFLVHARLTDRPYRDSWPLEESAAELRELVRSSGTQVLAEATANRERPIPATFIGKGKVEEVREQCHAAKADVVIFSEDLSAQQQRNLEEALGIKVIDRTQLILDIFAQRAHSQEGKVQVELAQLEYLLPRLSGKGVMLSRLGGGIGTRGPGEQKLEVDRRRIRARISRLSKELQEIGRRRGVARQKRRDEQLPTVALVGYTNAGKSTLLNTLTQADAQAENRLFSTLDPLARRLVLANHQSILLTDTVGFLHRLPHRLIEAFQATLEEVVQSDLLLHVMDASHPMREEQALAVHEVLESLDAHEKSTILVLNKIDQIDAPTLDQLLRQYPDAVPISAKTGKGIPLLLDRLMATLSMRMQEAQIVLSHQDQQWLKPIYEQGQVLAKEISQEGVRLKARIPQRLYGQLAKLGLLC